MIKCICIDGYNTIENGTVLKNTMFYDLSDLASLIGCQEKDIEDHAAFFRKSYGDYVWEYHEIFWRSLVKRFRHEFNESLIEQVYERFLDYYESEVELFEGTYNALVKLSECVRLILVANGNSKRLKRLIRKFNFNSVFDDYVISSETPYQKPDKFMFEYALRMYGWRPYEVMMVGDKYDNDVMGAKKCGLLTAIRISKTKAPITCDLTPDFMINSISELCDIVDISQHKKLQLIEPIDRFEQVNSNKVCAFIAAGGKGSRLGELGTKTQKCMLLLWGKPLLYYTILSLKNAGCSKIVIGVNHLSNQVIDYFGNGESLGVEIEYVEGEFNSTYDSLYHSMEHLTDRIIYVHANILFQNKLLENIINLGDNEDISIVALVDSKTNNVKHAQMDIDDNDYITNIDLLERNGTLPYTFLGVAYYKKSDFLSHLDNDASGFVNSTGMVEKVINQKLLAGEKTLAYKYFGGWRHIETEFDYINVSHQNRWEIYYE